MPPTSNSRTNVPSTPISNSNYTTLLLWYIGFGTLHELAHIATAIVLTLILGGGSKNHHHEPQATATILTTIVPTFTSLFLHYDGVGPFLYRLFIGRYTIVSFDDNESITPTRTPTMDIIRHSGWIFSTFLCVVIIMLHSRYVSSRCVKNSSIYRNSTSTSNYSNATIAATITAIEAITTDLLQWNQFHTGTINTTIPSTDTRNYWLVFCGNFGIIALHHIWFDNYGQTALEILEKMINITMMRGAQSGGVITFVPTTKHTSNSSIGDVKGIRSRCVNSKRTDLSKLVCAKVYKDVFASSIMKRLNNTNNNNNPFPPGYVAVLSGHTRFATSSQATMDGTHPHQWTPPSPRRLHVVAANQQGYVCSLKMVENYITHNGDFDFYTVNGKTYDLDAIQKWLVHVTGCPMPAIVDSCAIAGMVDLLRTQGCFGLSIRYTLCLGLPTSTICVPPNEDATTTNSSSSFPSYQHCETVGLVFEHVLNEMVKDTTTLTLETIGNNLKIRQSFAERVCSKLLSRQAELLDPMKHYMSYPKTTLANHNHQANTNNSTNDEECGTASTDGCSNTDPDEMQVVLTFCLQTIHSFFDNDLFYTTKTFLKNAKGSFGLCITSSMDIHRQVCLASRGQTISIAFYPNKGLICYGSELAAVKAGMGYDFPSPKSVDVLGRSKGDVDNDALRLDLDDLGGEIIVLDWGCSQQKKLSYLNNNNDTNPTTNSSIDTNPTSCGSVPIVSYPHRHLMVHELMNGYVHAVLYQESKTTKHDVQIYHRMIRLSCNPLIKPMRFMEHNEDMILADIQEIPQVCEMIQDDWHSKKAGTSLNRLTAYNLSRCLRSRLEQRIASTRNPNQPHNQHSIDILLTGCEVSLWLAEQFASDLQKSFPKLCIQAMSSNKILGLYGQEIPIPTFGFPYSTGTSNTASNPHTLSFQEASMLHDTIVIIVSHSGGTFAPLCCSTLLQSTTPHIFVVTSEWDTQIGKQLRHMDMENTKTHHQHPRPKAASDNNDTNEPKPISLFNSRVFSTEIGIRPAEPCSISVVATHQLLTNLFEYIAVVILSDVRYCSVSGARITEQDLQILETCNRSNIGALSEIVGTNSRGWVLDDEKEDNQGLLSRIRRKNQTKSNNSIIEKELRAIGTIWSDHILEVTKAYIMTALYIFGTVTSGYSLLVGIVHGGLGVDKTNPFMYLVRLLDAAIYFWLPQINILLLRWMEGRNLYHRMTSRTIVIGDIPWVSQAAEAFLSKIFACSYSIAGIHVYSGNPSDHLVHRFTHRVVRGTLLICGRPDGRLSALSTAEAAVCLSINQASSIQNLGMPCCESISIGHNPFQLPLCYKNIFLKRKRPLFLCERLLLEADVQQENQIYNQGGSCEANVQQENEIHEGNGGGIVNHYHNNPSSNKEERIDQIDKENTIRTIIGLVRRIQHFGLIWLGKKQNANAAFEANHSLHDASIRPAIPIRRSTAAIVSAYMNLEEMQESVPESVQFNPTTNNNNNTNTNIHETDDTDDILSNNYKDHDEKDNNDTITVDEIVSKAIVERKWLDHVRQLFHSYDIDQDGCLSYDEFKEGISKLKPLLYDTNTTTETEYMELFEQFVPTTTIDTINNTSDGVVVVESKKKKTMDRHQFVRMLRTLGLHDTKDMKIPPSHIDERTGLIQISASTEKYFGETIRKYNNNHDFKKTNHQTIDPTGAATTTQLDFMVARNQQFAQELYETRIASLQRFVSMIVLFHQMGTNVQQFLHTVSFGLCSYRTDRTHSIMRIASTASPISGADIRQRIVHLKLIKKVHHSIYIIRNAYLSYKRRKEACWIRTLESQVSILSLSLSSSTIITNNESAEKNPTNSSTEMIVPNTNGGAVINNSNDNDIPTTFIDNTTVYQGNCTITTTTTTPPTTTSHYPCNDNMEDNNEMSFHFV